MTTTRHGSGLLLLVSLSFGLSVLGACGSNGGPLDSDAGLDVAVDASDTPAPVDLIDRAADDEAPGDASGDGDHDNDLAAPDHPLDVTVDLAPVPDGVDSPPDVSEADGSDGGDTGGEDADASSDGDAGLTEVAPEVAPPWSPAHLEGVVLWLDASVGITTGTGQRVELWRDQSGHDNHARQVDTALQPRLLTGSIAGRASVSFRPGPKLLMVTDSESLRPGTGDFAAWAVVRCTSVETLEAIFYKTQFNNPYAGFQMWVAGPAGNLLGNTSATTILLSAQSGLNDNLPHLFAVQRAGGTLTLRVDGVEVSRAPGGDVIDVSAVGQNLYFGAHFVSLASTLRGEIGEFVLVKGPLLPADREKLEAYLLSRYQITAATTEGP